MDLCMGLIKVDIIMSRQAIDYYRNTNIKEIKKCSSISFATSM